MINYRLVIKCWGGYHGGGIRATDDFMSVDHKAFKTAVWKALDGAKNQLFFTLLRNFPKQQACQQTRNQFRKI